MSSSKWFRIIPVAFIMYMLAYMDRINVGILLPYIQKDLHLSAAASGEIAGIFFWGYMLLQIPGGLLASKWSARKVIFILMILWGIAAIGCGFVKTEEQLKVARFLLGIAEGGVWPSVLVMLARWFTLKERARANACWMACLPVSAMLMAPLSGILLKHFSWQTVFIIEGIPPLIWAFVWWFLVYDKPSDAAWMDQAERAKLEAQLAEEQGRASKTKGYGAAFKNKTVWCLVVMYLFWMTGFYGYTMWVPSVVKTFSTDSSVMGWLTAIPFTSALFGMVLNSYWSDRRMNRVQHIVVPLLIAAASMVAGQFVTNPYQQMILLSITAIGVYAPYGPLWAIPTAVIPGSIVGAALGLQNALGNLGGYYGPKFVGVLKDKTGKFHTGFYFLASMLVLASLMVLIIGTQLPKPKPKPKPEPLTAPTPTTNSL